MKISIAIPSYEYGGYGAECLEYSFNRMLTQTYKDFDVVISDSSMTNDIRNLCNKWSSKLDIKYYRNKSAIGNPAGNMNNAVNKSTGEWIKLLCQDDFLLFPDSLEIIEKEIDDSHDWIVTAYLHTYDRVNYQNYHFPYLNPRIYVVNTIGTPSCAVIRNFPEKMNFDDNLTYCYDCEFYYRFFLEHGTPKSITYATIANYLWDESITSKITSQKIEEENIYILRKHGFMNEDDRE